MPSQVLNRWNDLGNGITTLTVMSNAVGEVDVLVDSEIVPQLQIYRWGYDKKTRRFSYGEAYTRTYLHRKIAEIYEKAAVATVNTRDPFDLRKSQMLWRPA